MLPSLLPLLALLQRAAPAAPTTVGAFQISDAARDVLLFGGVLFWSVALLFVLILSVQVAREAGFAAFLTLLAGIVVLARISRFPVHTWVLAHPAVVLRWAVVYYAGGIAWASYKFVRYHRNRVRPYREWRQERLAEYGVTTPEELSDEQAFRYQEAAAKAGFALRSMGQTKHLRAYSRDFVFWASYWPFALLGTLLRFVFRDAFTAIFRGVFAAVGGRIRTWLAALYREVHADRDVVLAKAEAYRARREGGEGKADGGPDAEPGGGPGGASGGARRVVVRTKP